MMSIGCCQFLLPSEGVIFSFTILGIIGNALLVITQSHSESGLLEGPSGPLLRFFRLPLVFHRKEAVILKP